MHTLQVIAVVATIVTTTFSQASAPISAPQSGQTNPVLLGDDVTSENAGGAGGAGGVNSTAELGAFLEDPDTVPADPVEDEGQLITLPFNLTITQATNVSAGDIESLRKRYYGETTMYLRNGTIENGKNGKSLLANPMDRTKALAFLDAAKTFAAAKSASDSCTACAYTNADYSLVVFIYETVPGMRPPWYIFYEIVTSIQRMTNYWEENEILYKGFIIQGDGGHDGNPAESVVDFNMVPSFGDVAVPAGGGPKKRTLHPLRNKRSKAGSSRFNSLTQRHNDASGILAKRDGTFLDLGNGIKAQVIASSVQLMKGMMTTLADQLYSQLERDALRATIYYRQAIAEIPPEAFMGVAGTQVAAASATAFFHVLAANGQRFDWGFLINFVGGMRARGLRAHWHIDAGNTPAVGGLIMRGTEILGAWCWGLDVHSFLAEVGQEALNQVACTFGTITGQPAHTCFNRIEL